MEEFVGKFWYNLVIKSVVGYYLEVVVKLVEVEKIVGILFCVFGGDFGLKVVVVMVEIYGVWCCWL